MSGELHHPFDDDDGDFPDRTDAADDSEVQELCRLALVELDEGRADTARELAGAAIEVDADHPYPLFVLGVVAESEGDLAAARYLSERALSLASSNADLIQFRAQILLQDGDSAEALKVLRYGVALHPSDPDLHAQHARTLLADGRSVEARTAALASLRLDAGNLGAREVVQATGTSEADQRVILAALRQGAQLHPDDAYAQLELAAAELEAGHITTARRLLDRAYRLAPDDHAIRTGRRMLAEGYDRPLLRPVPGLLAWLAAFPGGLAGFLGMLAALSVPLLMAARADSGLIPLAVIIIGGWALVAAYAWLGPLVADHLLNRSAARAAAREEHTEPVVVADTIALQTAAGQMRAAGRTARSALRRGVLAEPAQQAAAEAVLLLTTGIGARLAALPLLSRIAVPVGTVLAVTAAGVAGIAPVVAISCLGVGGLLLALGQLAQRTRNACLGAAAAIAGVE